MAEERVTTVETPQGNPTTTHTTVIRDEEPRRGGGAGWLIAIVLIVAVIAGVYIFSQTSASDAAKNNAIANAADNVGEAATKVGDAAQTAANSIAK